MSNQYTYAADVTDLDITLTDAVTISVNESTGTGRAATGSHSGLAGQQCGIYFGDASAANASPATQPGFVTCN